MNYKPNYRDRIGTTVTHIIQNNEKLVILHAFQPYAVAAQSMQDGSTNSDYTVTTGKTFHAVSMVYGGGLASSFQLYSGDTADAKTTAISNERHTSPVNHTIDVPVHFTLASGKFLTVDVVSGTTMLVLTISGYET